jgi:hypothetical protein
MTTVTLDYMTQHVRGELGRGKPERCPRSWLIKVRAAHKGTGLAEACDIALDVLRSDSNHNPRCGEMKRLARTESLSSLKETSR